MSGKLTTKPSLETALREGSILMRSDLALPLVNMSTRSAWRKTRKEGAGRGEAGVSEPLLIEEVT